MTIHVLLLLWQRLRRLRVMFQHMCADCWVLWYNHCSGNRPIDQRIFIFALNPVVH